MQKLLFLLTFFANSILFASDLDDSVRADLVSVRLDDIKKQITLIIIEEKLLGKVSLIDLDYSKRNSDFMRMDAVDISRDLVGAIANNNRILFTDRGFSIVKPKEKKISEELSFSDIVFNPSHLRLVVTNDDKTIYLFFSQRILNGFQHYLLGYNSFDSKEDATAFALSIKDKIDNSRFGLRVSDLGSGIKVTEASPAE